MLEESGEFLQPQLFPRVREVEIELNCVFVKLRDLNVSEISQQMLLTSISLTASGTFAVFAQQLSTFNKETFKISLLQRQ